LNNNFSMRHVYFQMEKIDALRRLGEVKEKSESAFHYGAAIEAYAARQKEVMAENRK